jgi:hypothetical protein
VSSYSSGRAVGTVVEVGSDVGVHVLPEVALGGPFLCLADAVVPRREMAMDFLQDGRYQGIWEKKDHLAMF